MAKMKAGGILVVFILLMVTLLFMQVGTPLVISSIEDLKTTVGTTTSINDAYDVGILLIRYVPLFFVLAEVVGLIYLAFRAVKGSA